VSRVLAYLIRFAVIVIGYAVASIIATGGILTMLAFFAWLSGKPVAGPLISFRQILLLVYYVGYWAVIPSAVVVLWAEASGRRDWPFYVGTGFLVGIITGGGLATYLSDSAAAIAFSAVVAMPAGMLGGAVYWLIAGKTSGALRDAWAARGIAQ
jgi:hypothetical protein